MPGSSTSLTTTSTASPSRPASASASSPDVACSTSTGSSVSSATTSSRTAGSSSTTRRRLMASVDELPPHRGRDGLCPCDRGELPHRVADVGSHRVGSDVERAADRLVAVPVGEEAEDAALALAELGGLLELVAG